MNNNDLGSAKSRLNKLLSNISLAQSMSDQDWDLCIRQAQSANLLGRLYYLLDRQQLLNQLPSKVVNHLYAAHLRCQKQHQDIRDEALRLSEIITAQELELTYLKGAAYVLNEIAFQGRTCSDIDILVKRSQLPTIEKLLQQHGWAPEALNDYDQKFYRQWMHEIPPMIHLSRGTILDIHHNIVPLTSDKIPDANHLLDGRQPINKHSKHYVLAPIDMILHSAAHLFSEGELNKGLRDLTDLVLLFEVLFDSPDSEHHQAIALIERAKQLNLETSLAYAIRYCEKTLHFTLPLSCKHYAKDSIKDGLRIKLLDLCYSYTFVPYHSSCQGLRFELACCYLYIRSHLMKMPLRLLLPHLSIKWWRRTKKLFIVN